MVGVGVALALVSAMWVVGHAVPSCDDLARIATSNGYSSSQC